MNVPLIWLLLGASSSLCLALAVVWQQFWFTKKIEDLRASTSKSIDDANSGTSDLMRQVNSQERRLSLLVRRVVRNPNEPIGVAPRKKKKPRNGRRTSWDRLAEEDDV